MKIVLYKYYLIIFLFILPVFAVYPITTLYAESLGATVFEIGLMNALFSVLPLIIAISIGKTIDRIGEKIPLVIGSVGISVALIIPYFYESIISLYIMKLLLGGFQLTGVLATQNGVQKVTLPEERTKSVANFSLFSSVGIFLGPLIGSYLATSIGYQLTYLILSILTIIPLFVAFKLPSDPIVKVEDKQGSIAFEIKDLLNRPGLAPILLISMISLSTLDIFYIYFPLYAHSIGLSLTEIGWVLSVQGFCNVITRTFLANFIKRVGYINLLILSLLLGGVAFAVLILFNNLIYIFLIASLIGIGLGIIQPLTTTLTFQFASEGKTGLALGLRLMSNRFGQIVLPLMFSGIVTVGGIGGIFVLASLLLFIGVSVGKLYIREV